MPHLRRQPHPRNPVPSQNPNTPPDLRAQYQTPPTRHPNPTQLSTGPDAFTPEAAEAGHPAAGIDPFAIFGRPRADAQALMMDADFDDDYDPRISGMDDLGDDQPSPDDSFDVDQAEEGQFDDSDIEEQQEDGDEVFEGDVDEEMQDRERTPTPLPPNLREISSLASWTVSTSKPGCGVAALRNPSPQQYWQSDGPQPHTLTLHFFKLVAVVKVRVFLDFDLDESYTPTKMIFAAGMGGNDLVEFATWEGEGPCGWVDIPLEGVGGRNGGWVRSDSKPESSAEHRVVYRNCEDAEHDHDEECDPVEEDEDEDPYSGNVLKAMVIQMRIMENHQNGKDTHVRGFQVFACDDIRRKIGNGPSASADDRRRGQHDLRGMASEEVEALPVGMDEPDWMGEPVIR
ncbi:unnamed protein product [Penicillium olsonii]|nr:unnamed protein product [Penicillium olsonii]CAG7922676.1 unnamed protein product [Penicillium olsonii]